MAQLTDMLDRVRGVAYGAPDPILVRSLSRAAQELCQYSHAWRELLPTISLRAGVDRYQLLAPDGAHVERLVWVKINGRQACAQMRPDELLLQVTTTGMPRYWAQASADQDLLLWPTPRAVEAGTPVQAFAVLVLNPDGETLPDGLVQEYGPGIIAWAKWDLLANAPEQPWHNPQASQPHRHLADEIFARAKRAQHSGHSMPLTVQPRRFI
jgi:hypothetical protein